MPRHVISSKAVVKGDTLKYSGMLHTKEGRQDDRFLAIPNTSEKQCNILKYWKGEKSQPRILQGEYRSKTKVS